MKGSLDGQALQLHRLSPWIRGEDEGEGFDAPSRGLPEAILTLPLSLARERRPIRAQNTQTACTSSGTIDQHDLPIAATE